MTYKTVALSPPLPRLKDALNQALMLRGSRDFDSVDGYTGFVGKVVDRRNRLVKERLEQELPHLQCLPPAPAPEYVNYRARVRKWSTIQAAGRTYTVPSRLIGKEVQIRLYADYLEVYYKGAFVELMERIKGEREARSITGTSSAPPVVAEGRPWCASPGPSTVTGSGSRCFPP